MAMEGSDRATGGWNRTQPLRVMHVIDRLQPGGMELGVVKLVNGLAAAEISSSICSTRPTALRDLVREDVPVFELNRREGNDPRLVWELYRLFRRERPHIVHTHAWGTLIEGWSAARLAGVPRVVHGEHGTLQLRPSQVRAQRFVWGRVDRLLSVSSRLAERMSAATGFPLSRIHVVRNGVDLSRFATVERDAARRSLDLPDGAVAIGIAGRLVPVKNQALFLDAVARLAALGDAPVALVAGEGPLRNELEARAASLGVTHRVRFLGHRPDLERVYRALDVFVLSSDSEGLSNTILEAMASGVPVVATRVGGADELVEDGVSGLLVPPGDVEALSGALHELVVDPDRRARMGSAARTRSYGLFGLPQMVRNYRQAYYDVAHSGEPRPGIPEHPASARTPQPRL